MKRWINKSFLVEELGHAEELTQQEIRQNSKGEYDYYYYLGMYAFIKSFRLALQNDDALYVPATYSVAEKIKRRTHE